MIPKEIIDNIFETALIEEVVGDFVSLKKRGANLIGVCPFHNEKTPSFTVSPAKGIYKCFGCGKGGNSVNFIMEHEQYNYPQALRFLAKKYNIEIPEIELSSEQIELANQKESLFIVNNYANEFFQKKIESTEGVSIAKRYLKEREISEEFIKKFQIGYSPKEWDALTKNALNKGYKKEYLEKSGLSIFKEKKYFDRFRERIIFPIHSLSGRILGFGGRSLSNEKKISKYINSPESDIYQKSKILYGLYFGKSEIIKNDCCYIVEGYTDVIAMHHANIKNVVSSSGTALSLEQIRLINRYTKNINILYDGDEAGLKAAFRGIDLVLSEGLNVKIILFPKGEDPDSFSKKYGSGGLKKLVINEAKDFLTFKTQLLKKDCKNDPSKKVTLIKEIVNSISIIPDQIKRAVYIKECSKLLEVSESILVKEISTLKSRNKSIRFNNNDKDEKQASLKNKKPLKYNSEHQERNIIRFLICYGDKYLQFDEDNSDLEKNDSNILVSKFIIDEIFDEVIFENPLYSEILNIYAKIVDNNEIPSSKKFTQHNNSNISQLATDLLSSKYELSENWKKHGIYTNTEETLLKSAVENAVYSLKIKKIEAEINQAQIEMQSQDDKEQTKTLIKMNKLLMLKKLISKKLGRTIFR